MSDKKNIGNKTLEKLRGWGGSRELSAAEAMMWLAEADPRLRSSTTSILVLDVMPDWDRLVASHEWVTHAAPRLRQRVLEPALNLDMPVWMDDPEFLLDYHLRRVSLPLPCTQRQLFDLAQTLAMTPFDRFRPPWEAVLVEGLEQGQAAYILKLHHALFDGMDIIQLMRETLSRSRHGWKLPALKSIPKRRVSTSLELAAQGALHRFLELPQDTTDSLFKLLETTVELLRKPEALREVCDYLASARRMLGAHPENGSPILCKRGINSRFDAIEIPYSDIDQIALGIDASLDEIFLASLIGGFRLYHEQMGTKLDKMPIAFPVSPGTDGDTSWGNKFASAQYLATISERNPLKRIKHIRSFVRKASAEPALDIIMKFAPVAIRLPQPMLSGIVANMTTAQDARICHIHGITHPRYMAGSHITDIWSFTPTLGSAMAIAMVSHEGRCCIGINSDRAALTHPELLIDCLRQGFHEMMTWYKSLNESGVKPAARPTSKRAVNTASARRKK